MRRRWLFILACIAFLPTAALAAQAIDSPWSVHLWQAGSGPNGNYVSGIVQTPDGFLWVATLDGLARFDGVKFDHYLSTDFVSDASGNSRMRLLIPRRSGGMWAVLDGGWLMRLEPGKPPVVVTKNLPTVLAESAIEDRDGAVWIVYHSGPVCRIADGIVTQFTSAQGVPAGNPESLALDNLGRVWVIKATHIARFQNGRFQSMGDVPSAASHAVAAADGGLFICSDVNLFKYVQGAPPQRLASLRDMTPSMLATVMYQDTAGRLWIGTSFSGLFCYADSKVEKVPVSNAMVASIAEDSEGNIWVGTRSGLDRIRPRAVALEGSSVGLPFGAVQSICQDASGQIWGITPDGFIVRRGADGWKTELTGVWPGGTATCIAAAPDGTIWIGTRNRKIRSWKDGKLVTLDVNSGVVGHTITSLLAARSGDIWVGEYNANAVQIIHNGVLRDLPFALKDHRPRAIAEAPNGDIWIAADLGLLLHISGDSIVDESARVGDSQTLIRCLTFTPDGALWIGYDEQGLGRLKNGKFARIRASQGLASDTISLITPDGRGWLWIGSSGGISKVRQADLDAVAEGRATTVHSFQYGDEEMPDLQANFHLWPASLLSSDGRVWMAMDTALAVITPERSREQTTPPRVVVTQVTVDGDPIGAYSDEVPIPQAADIRQRAGLRLPPDHHKVQFDYTALNFSSPASVRFRYRLEGLDDDWIDAGVQRSVSYSRLSPGNYWFHVMACNDSGIWSDAAPAVAIVVDPHFWQTWWFRVAAAAAFASIVAGIVRFVSVRRFHMKLRELERQAALDKERARIAKDIHDQLGCCLTRIVLLSELMTHQRGGPGGPERSGKHLQQIFSSAREGIKSLDETVWAINPRNDTVPDLIDYTGQFVVDFLRTANIRCHVDLPDQPLDRHVASEVRHNVFLVIKEAVNNLVKHSHASEAWLRVSVLSDSLNMSISDNGAGFNGHNGKNGHHGDGLRNMRQRMEDIGGRFNIKSEPGAGTVIDLVVPWK